MTGASPARRDSADGAGQWTYLLKAFQWARKYGIRINLDMHSCPGSQNGYNHSGRGTNVRTRCTGSCDAVRW